MDEVEISSAPTFLKISFARPFSSPSAADRDQIVTPLEFILVALGFDLGNSHSDQTAYQAARACADGRAAEGCHERTRRDEWTYAGDSERADSSEKTEHSTCDAARGRASGRAFRRFGSFDMTDVVLSLTVRQEHGDFRCRKAGCLQLLD